MNELIRVEENVLIIAENAIEQIKGFENKRKLIDAKEKEFKEKLLRIMEESGIEKYSSPDGSLKIAYTPETETATFDSKRFKEEHLDMYYNYQKKGKRKASIRMTVK